MSVYHCRIRDDDLLELDELAGRPIPAEPRTGIGLAVLTTHFGTLAATGDSALTMIGQLTTDKPPRGHVYVGNRRADSVKLHRRGRNRRQGARWHRIIESVRDSRDVIGDVDFIADATLGLNPTVVSPNEVLGELLLVGDANHGLAGGTILAIAPGAGLAMVAGSTLTAAGVEIFAGTLPLVGDATVRMRGTGGTNASVDPDQRRGGIVAIGIRGGHS